VVALEPVPLPILIKESDAVVVGKLEITREKGLVVTWYPEMKNEEKQTTYFHMGRIRVSKLLRKHSGIPYGPGYYPVAFDSGLTLTNGTQSIWLLRWNGLVGRYALSQPYPNSLAEVEKAIVEVERDEVKK
jgi:hypothetical protein